MTEYLQALTSVLSNALIVFWRSALGYLTLEHKFSLLKFTHFYLSQWKKTVVDRKLHVSFSVYLFLPLSHLLLRHWRELGSDITRFTNLCTLSLSELWKYMVSFLLLLFHGFLLQFLFFKFYLVPWWNKQTNKQMSTQMNIKTDWLTHYPGGRGVQ